MTIREVAQLTGLSHQAIYKRIKAQGLKLDELKDKATGQLTPDGEAIIRELFTVESPANSPVNGKKAAVSNQVEELRNQVAELTTEVEKLRNQVASLENERDFLREALEREQKNLERQQQLTGMVITKLPTPAPALPSGEKGKLRAWWDKVRKRG